MASIETQQLRQLVDAHGAALALYARQWCYVPDDAVQEALIELVREEPVPDNPVAWLYKTVRRRAMNLARAESRRAKHHRQASEQKEPWFTPSDSALDDPQDLEKVLGELDRVDREIVVARIWGDRSLQEIAELIELSTSSVHRRYHQALKKLGRLLDGQGLSGQSKEEQQDEFRTSTP